MLLPCHTEPAMEDNAALHESIPEGCKPLEPVVSAALSSGACLCQGVRVNQGSAWISSARLCVLGVFPEADFM